ncbi:hypothetical protein [Flavobacterium glaciei]|uniref:Uncharacterized protein n=1 Tax=Flavobacterium glaciei TaxID=386300 RepID=A0A562PX97_9FLAO|nr:hypothetical protein [Flavobacterium glaciei]RDI56475.1 hypothetical protein DFR66_10437 [Flavobacterium glaciei]TWI49045.1 hypothetical protein IQ02_01030 [Flavobacterium glaciei]
MKLTNQQTEYVSNYIKSFDIKWYELQVEFTDHMVTSMEEIWNQNPMLTFEQVKENTFKKFTNSELKSIEKERKQILIEQFHNEQRKKIKTYLSFPKIMGCILLFFTSFTLSFFFDNPFNYVAVLVGSLYIFAIPMLCLFYKNRKIQGKRFLATETVHPWFTLMGVPQLCACLVPPFKEEINQYPAVVLVFCMIWTLGILFVASATYLQKQSINTIKKQYQLN